MKVLAVILLLSTLGVAQARLEVFSPPSVPPAWLVNNTLATGATFFVKWSAVEPTQGSFTFSGLDNRLAPWIRAGKKVNLIVEANNLSAPNNALPGWMWPLLGSSNVAMCSNEEIPNYFTTVFQSQYKQLMAAFTQHYASNRSIGYIRFGLGRGGETHPSPTQAFQPGNSCYATFLSWGWTSTTWVNYIAGMLQYEASLRAPFPLLVTISDELGNHSIADNIAGAAMLYGIGLGYQGYSTNDISKYIAGKMCGDDFCALYNRYAGAELELQLGGKSGSLSDPTGGGSGSLVDLLPFGIQRHATIFELNYQDWRIAFDPTASYYPQYHLSYETAMRGATQ